MNNIKPQGLKKKKLIGEKKELMLKLIKNETLPTHKIANQLGVGNNVVAYNRRFNGIPYKTKKQRCIEDYRKGLSKTDLINKYGYNTVYRYLHLAREKGHDPVSVAKLVGEITARRDARTEEQYRILRLYNTVAALRIINESKDLKEYLI